MSKHTPSSLNALLDQGKKAAEGYEADLREAYYKPLSRAVDDMAARFGALTASSAEWQLPDIDELYDKAAVIAAARANSEEARISVIQAVMTGVLTDYGLTFDLRNPFVAHLLEQQGQHIVGIVETHRQEIMAVLRDQWEQGATIQAAQAAILETGIDRTLVGAETIARTELVSSMNGASLASVHLTGAAEYKKWLTAPGAPNPRHATYEGLGDQVKPIAGLFQVGGYPAQYPGDPSLPPGESINCRCSMAFTDNPEGLTASWTYDDHLWVPTRRAIQNATGAEVAYYPLDQEDAMSTTAHTIPAITGTTETAAQEAVTAAAPTPDWTSPQLAAYDTMTRDARMIAMDALTWSPPMPLMLQDGDNHGGGAPPMALNAGAITAVTPDGRSLTAEGTFDEGSVGDRARELALTGRYGVSVDLAVQDYEWLINTAGYDMWWDLPIPTDPPPGVTPAAAQEEIDAARAEDEVYQDANGEVVLPEGWYKMPVHIEDEVLRITRGEIMGATMVPFAAFKDAHIIPTALAADGSISRVAIIAPIQVVGAPLVPAVTAAAAGLAPLLPPAEWFENPNLSGPTPFTITDEGEVYGHIAVWGTCHTGHPGRCVTCPPGVDGYSGFLLGEVKCADGSRVPVGRLTIGTGHADLSLNAADTVAHYDNTGTAFADVTIGDDEHGPWVHGALRPGVSAELVREAMSSPLSGDWRPRDGYGPLELKAILCVNVPGFPVTRARVASGRVTALVAAGQFHVLPTGSFEHRMKALHARATGGMDALHALAKR